jgi:hypothetical protein
LDRIVEHIPVQVGIAGGERERVLAQETTDLRIVPAGTVVIQAQGGVELTSRELDDQEERFAMQFSSEIMEAKRQAAHAFLTSASVA